MFLFKSIGMRNGPTKWSYALNMRFSTRTNWMSDQVIMCHLKQKLISKKNTFHKNNEEFNWSNWKTKTWRCRGSNPGPFTCKANALPLSHTPTYEQCIVWKGSGCCRDLMTNEIWTPDSDSDSDSDPVQRFVKLKLNEIYLWISKYRRSLRGLMDKASAS